MIRFSAIVFITLLVFASCSQVNSPNLLPDYYSHSEIDELNKLVDFVVEQTSKDCNTPSTECLYHYFDQFENLGADDAAEFGISQEFQKELLQHIDKNLFDDIWAYCEGTRSIAKDSVFATRSLCVRSDGRFAQLLKKSSELNPDLKDYYESFQWAGSFSPSMNTLLVKQTNKFDLNTEHELLLVTVHLLTLNHPVEVK